MSHSFTLKLLPQQFFLIHFNYRLSPDIFLPFFSPLKNMSSLYSPPIVKDKILMNISAAIREVCIFDGECLENGGRFLDYLDSSISSR